MLEPQISPYYYNTTGFVISSTGLVVDVVETRPAPPAKPRGWGALEARIGKAALAALEKDGPPYEVPSRRWPGVLFQVYKDGAVVATLGAAEVGRASAPAYPWGNGGPPPWPEVVLGRLVLLAGDETLLFGDGPLGDVVAVSRSVRVRGRGTAVE